MDYKKQIAQSCKKSIQILSAINYQKTTILLFIIPLNSHFYAHFTFV